MEFGKLTLLVQRTVKKFAILFRFSIVLYLLKAEHI